MNTKNTTNTTLKQSFARLLRRTTCSTTSDATPRPPVSVQRAYYYHLNNLPLSFNSLEPHTNHSCKKNYKKVTKKERRITETGCFYETGVREGRRCPPSSPISPLKYSPYFFCFDNESKRGQKKKKKKNKKLLSNAYGFSTSSSSDEEVGGFFSSEDGEEGREDCSETLFSSKSFSSDSSEFYQRPLSIASKRITRKKDSTSSSSRRRRTNNGYRPLVSMMSYDDHKKKKKKKVKTGNLVMDDNEEDDEDGEKKGIAVVKKSKDPYGDFRSSMLEMIVERQMFGPRDLQRLLHSYLSLNSDHHHPIILKAFSDIWEALFSN